MSATSGIGSWSRRHQLRLADAVYVQLAVSRGVALITTDGRLRAAPAAEVVVISSCTARRRPSHRAERGDAGAHRRS